MKKIIILSLFFVSLVLIVGCTSGNDGFTDDEREVLSETGGDSALAGQATDLGCITTGKTFYTCTETATGVSLTYRTRRFSMQDGCKLRGTMVYDYSCPRDGKGFTYCRTRCTEGCEEGITMCDEDINGCSDSDEGLTYNVRGSVTVEGVVTYDSCTTALDGGSETESSDFLMEEFCTEDDTESGAGYTCPYGCVNGACQPACEPEGGYQLSADGMSVKTCSSGRWVDVMCEENCMVVGATACTAGVSCPGNVVVPATGCPAGQSCDGTGVCEAEPSCVEGTNQSLCVDGVITINMCSGGAWVPCTGQSCFNNNWDCPAMLGTQDLDVGFSPFNRSNTCALIELASYTPGVYKLAPNCEKCGAKICIHTSGTWIGREYVAGSYSKVSVCNLGDTDTGRVVSGEGCPATCTDSDSSRLDIKGNVTVVLGSGRTITYEDTCLSSAELVEFNCERSVEGGNIPPALRELIRVDSLDYPRGTKVCQDGAVVVVS